MELKWEEQVANKANDTILFNTKLLDSSHLSDRKE